MIHFFKIGGGAFFGRFSVKRQAVTREQGSERGVTYKVQHSNKRRQNWKWNTHTHTHKRAGLIRSLASHRPYGVTVAEVKGGDYLSEELPGLFGGQPAFLHQVVK